MLKYLIAAIVFFIISFLFEIPSTGNSIFTLLGVGSVCTLLVKIIISSFKVAPPKNH